MHRPSSLAIVGAVAILAISQSAGAAQRTVRATSAWVEAPTGADARAFAVVENGTMYDVYVVGAESDAADAIELMQTTAGKIAATKEIPIAAFDRLEMSPDETFLKLTGLKRPLKPGESITIVLRTDTGERLSVAATVK